MSGWYYRQSGMLEDINVGPFADNMLLQLAFEGKIAAATLVVHPTHTKGQWVALEQIPAAKSKLSEGDQHRAATKVLQQQAKEKRRVDTRAASDEERQRVLREASEKRANSPIAAFLLDGQPEVTIGKIYERVRQILTPEEQIEYMAVQAKPLMISPDCAVITNRRFIVFHQKMLGRADFEDHLWMYLGDAKINEGILYAELSFKTTTGHTFSIDYLPKAQARRIYRIAQQREELAIETRRNRKMEESRAGASNIVVNAATPPAVAPLSDDPMAKLQKLKAMLDAGLIEKDEYDATKSRILASM
jgi:hypothetical protein